MEQLAILKALEYIENAQTVDKKATIYTGSQTIMDMIENNKMHTNIIEDLRRKWYEIKEAGWQIAIQWVKAHVGIKASELADTLTKKATTNETITESYTRIPKSVVLSELTKESEKKWQRDWTQTTKGSTTKEYFPDIEGRLKMKLNLRESHIQSNGTRERESIPKSLQTHI